MLIEIDFCSPIPLYEQIIRAIVRGLAKRELQRGEALPSVRQLAADLGINLHTINKAYKILRDMGYVSLDRGSGTVLKDQIMPFEAQDLSDFRDEVEYLIADGLNRGVDREEFWRMTDEIFRQMENQK